MELIAKYLRNTEISPEILYQKFLEKDGVTNTQEVQIRQRKDRKLRSESVNSHLKILFDISGFDVIEREIIASLSLFDGLAGHNLKYYYVESKKPQKNSTVLFKMAGLYGTKLPEKYRCTR